MLRPFASYGHKWDKKLAIQAKSIKKSLSTTWCYATYDYISKPKAESKQPWIFFDSSIVFSCSLTMKDLSTRRYLQECW